MKIRRGFVTNSSSSSFICSICGEIEELSSEEGPDTRWITFDKCDHSLLLSELPYEIKEKLEELVIESILKESDCSRNEIEGFLYDGEYLDNYWDYSVGGDYTLWLDHKHCPICNFEVCTDESRLKFYKDKFGNFEDDKILSYLKEKRNES